MPNLEAIVIHLLPLLYEKTKKTVLIIERISIQVLLNKLYLWLLPLYKDNFKSNLQHADRNICSPNEALLNQNAHFLSITAGTATIPVICISKTILIIHYFA